jgi:hypothetical protein
VNFADLVLVEVEDVGRAYYLRAADPRRETPASTMEPERVHFMTMQSVKAHVKNGRLVLDEATDRPEGEIVELVPLDEVLANGGDYLDDTERERLHASLREGIRQMKAGETIDAAEAMAELRAHR